MKFANPRNDIAFKKKLKELNTILDKWVYFIKKQRVWR